MSEITYAPADIRGQDVGLQMVFPSPPLRELPGQNSKGYDSVRQLGNVGERCGLWQRMLRKCYRP